MVSKGIIFSLCFFALLAFASKPVDATQCELGPGQVYEQGQKFVIGCASCTCGGPFYSCVLLCPLEQCPPRTEAQYENRLVPGTDCTCKRIKACLGSSGK